MKSLDQLRPHNSFEMEVLEQLNRIVVMLERMKREHETPPTPAPHWFDAAPEK